MGKFRTYHHVATNLEIVTDAFNDRSSNIEYIPVFGSDGDGFGGKNGNIGALGNDMEDVCRGQVQTP